MASSKLAIFNDRQHRTEDFFLGDAHVGLHLVENRRLKKESLGASADGKSPRR